MLTDLPVELLFNILSYITDIRDIISCLKVCRLVRESIKLSSIYIDTQDKVQIPIENLINFHKLRYIGESILIFTKLYDTLQTIPNLRRANFYLGRFDNFTTYSTKCYEFISHMKIPISIVVDIKILSHIDNELILSVVQRNNIMFINQRNYVGSIEYMDKLKSLGLEVYRPVFRVKNPHGYYTQYLITKTIKTFLNNLNFGQSSFDSREISEIIKPLLLSGVISLNALRALFKIYAMYNKLDINQDELIRASLLMCPTLENFNEYTIPETEFNSKVISKIERVLLFTLNYYLPKNT